MDTPTTNVEVLEETTITDNELNRLFGLSSTTESPEDDDIEDDEIEEESSVDETSDSYKIPENSPSLLIDEVTSRFSSASWYAKIQQATIVLAGLGGIGSYVAFLLSRVNPKFITLYDPDIVERVNMSGQMYSISDVAKYKVEAIRRHMESYSDYFKVSSISTRFTNDSRAEDIMICGFDNMEARKIFFDKWVSHLSAKSNEDKHKCLFIDGRLNAEEFQVFCITGDDDYHINKYKSQMLFSDSEADETVCSYKQTSHCATMIASIIVNLFVNFIANECNPIIPRDLPFLTSYDATRMFFKTEMI